MKRSDKGKTTLTAATITEVNSAVFAGYDRGAIDCIPKIMDKNGREILTGDVLKVFHFTGARRKKHFMYKFVAGSRPNNCILISNLDRDQSTYLMKIDGQKHDDIEIVQGFGADGVPFDQRERS